MTRSPTRNDGNNGNTVNTFAKGKESELHRSTECELGNDEAEEDVVKAFNNSIGNMCKEVEQMKIWLSNNPNSRTGLREFVERASKELCALEKVRKAVTVCDKRRHLRIPSEKERISEEDRREIRKIVQRVSEGDLSQLEELRKKKWPESAFERTKVERCYPLSGGKRDNLALFFSEKKEENENLRILAERAFGEIDELMCDGIVAEGYQTIEIIRKKGENNPVSTHGFLLNSNSSSIQRLVSDIKTKNIKKLGIATTYANDQMKITEIRKMAEISFFGTDTEITIFCQGKYHSNEKPTEKKERDYEILKISTKSTNEGSYAEMAGKVKESLDPTILGVEIKGTKKSGKNEILIRTEKGGAERVIKQMNDKFSQESNNQLKVESISHRRPVIITNIETLATEEDLVRAIKKEVADPNAGMDIKKFHETKFGDRNAEVWLEDKHAKLLEERGKMRVTWCLCFIKRKERIDRCIRCLKLGHKASTCRAKDQKVKCLNCCKEGHNYNQCQEKTYCNECKVEGHSPTNTRCPAFRRMVSRKQRI